MKLATIAVSPYITVTGVVLSSDNDKITVMVGGYVFNGVPLKIWDNVSVS